MNARTTAALAFGKLAGVTSRLLGRGAGAQISGRVMLAVNPHLLRELATGHRIVLVSATNGKTTTTAMLASALRDAGKSVVSNETGANLASGIASTLASATEPSIAILEVDERVLAQVFDALQPELLVLGNLSRDQLDRYGEVRSIANSWREICEEHPDLRVIANASDPLVVWGANPAKTMWVNAGANWHQDASTCPQCGALLPRADASWHCNTCGLTEPEPNARLDGNQFHIDGQNVDIQLSLPGQWNIGNAALAIAAAVELGVDPSMAAHSMNDLHSVAGRYITHALPDGRSVQLLLAKNPAGWSEVLEYLADRDTGVVIALNARIADGRDPSWLYDVPFERLVGHSVAVVGERRHDIAVRLHYAGIEPLMATDSFNAAQQVEGKDVVIVASYTQFHALQRKWS